MSVFVERYPYPGNQSYVQLTKQKVEKAVHTKVYTADEVDALIKSAIASGLGKVLKTETVTFANLPTSLEDNLGTIYNITEAFETDDRFIEGAGKKFPAGTNLIVVNSNGEYKFDVFMGEITTSDEGIQDIIDDLYKDD